MAAAVDVARGVVLDDRYRLEEVIGQGGMATVYRAHDLVLDRDVAVKLFPPVPEGADDLLRHQAEMRVLAQLSHSSLVTLHDAGSAFAGSHLPQTYLVMELVQGPTLADRLLHGPLSPRHTARLGRQVAEALAAVHAADVVHRDVKPANVLLVDRERLEGREDEDPRLAITTGPVVKLADFGIARLGDGARLTITGTTLGTATYLSPEQASGGSVGPATDVYALGLVLLECLTGRKAFTGTMVEVAAARLTTAPQIPASLGADWAGLLEAMTRRAPADRPTASDTAAALAHIEEGAATTGEVPTAAHSIAAPVDAVDASEASDAGPHLPAVIPPRVQPGPARRRAEPEGTRQYSVAEIQREAERDARSPRLRPSLPASTAGEPRDDVPAGGGRRTVREDRAAGRRSLGAVVLAVVALLVVAGAVALGQSQRAEAAAVEPPSYPVVDGPLGDALTDLQRSVEP